MTIAANVMKCRRYLFRRKYCVMKMTVLFNVAIYNRKYLKMNDSYSEMKK